MYTSSYELVTRHGSQISVTDIYFYFNAISSNATAFTSAKVNKDDKMKSTFKYLVTDSYMFANVKVSKPDTR